MSICYMYKYILDVNSSPLVLCSLLRVHNSENKVDNDGEEKADHKGSRSKSIIETALSSPPNLPGSPVICVQRIASSQDRNGDES